ncbi:MAG: hypothetical protein U0105_03550 [Candidatus Obscuribacterales bacterium]
MKDVLQAVAEQDAGLYVLRIASKETDCAGRLAIADGEFIVGACTDQGESGYPAVREILAIGEGSFVLLDSGSEHPSDLKDVLHLSLPRLIEHLPNLPEDPGQLFDQGSLLDKLFGGKDAPVAPILPPGATDEDATAESGISGIQLAAPTAVSDEPIADEAVDAMEALIAQRASGQHAPLRDEPPADDFRPVTNYPDEISDTISQPVPSQPETWEETPVLRMALNAVIIVSLLTTIIFGLPTFIKTMESLRMQGNQVQKDEPAGS